MSERCQDLENIAPQLNRLAEDPNARVHYEGMSDGLVWSDELPPWDQFEPGACDCLRAVWRYRSSLIAGSPAEKYRPLWEQAQMLFPHWPGFDAQRRGSHWRQFLAQARDKFLHDWAELEKNYQDGSQVKDTAHDVPTI